MNLSVTLKGNCAPAWADSWHLVREGVFATDQNDARSVEAAIDGDVIYYRVTNTGDHAPAMQGVLALIAPGLYISYLTMDTSCGKETLRLEASLTLRN